jgi:hypothetical protein
MALRFDDTVLEPVELPPGVTGFGSAELLYLLARRDTAVMRRSREFLAPGVEGITDSSSPAFELVKAGASSLVARGLVSQEPADSALVSKAEAALVEYSASHASRWTRVTGVGENTRDMMLFLQAPGMTAGLQPRGLGSWFAGFNEGDAAPGHMVKAFIESVQQNHPDASCAVQTWTLEEGPESLFLSWHTEAARWTVLDRPENPDDEEPVLLDETALLEKLADLVPQVPADAAT